MVYVYLKIIAHCDLVCELKCKVIRIIYINVYKMYKSFGILNKITKVKVIQCHIIYNQIEKRKSRYNQ